MKIERMWINQPSSQQPLHSLHGQNVLAAHESENMYRIYFLSGKTVSMRAHKMCLSLGWKNNG